MTWCNGTTIVKWWALQHVVIALFLVCWSVDLLVYVVSGENYLPFL